MTPTRPTTLAYPASPLARELRSLLDATGWFDDGALCVLQLSWAPIYQQERVGSGLNLVASHLAAALRSRGARIAAIASGLTYRPFSGPHLAADRAWRNCACFNLINSTNLATGNFNFRNVNGQQSAPVDTRLLIDFARAAGVQVAHIHSFEGFPFDIVRALKGVGVPVVYTPHNYYALCPQIDLNRSERRVCDDFEGGNACVNCLAAPDPTTERRYRARLQALDAALGPGSYHALTNATRNAPRAFTNWITGGDARPHAPSTQPTGDSAIQATREAPKPDAPTPMHIKQADAHDPARINRLLNGDHHLRVLNAYGQRRVAAVDALNHATAVLCPSAFLLETHAAMGVSRDRLVHLPIALPHLDQLRAQAQSAPDQDLAPWRSTDPRPLRLCFLGTVHPNKGLMTLLRAVLSLTPSERDRIHLLVHATGGDEPLRRWLANVPQVAFLGAYDLARLASLAREYDVALFPNAGLDNSPLVVLEHLNLGKFTLASDLGGVTGLINPANGMRIPASDPAAWATALRALIHGDVNIPAPNQVRAASNLRCFEGFAHDTLVYLRRAALASHNQSAS
jgi:glycosyltransferase involved in cell wall biosynthesis